MSGQRRLRTPEDSPFRMRDLHTGSTQSSRSTSATVQGYARMGTGTGTLPGYLEVRACGTLCVCAHGNCAQATMCAGAPAQEGRHRKVGLRAAHRLCAQATV